MRKIPKENEEKFAKGLLLFRYFHVFFSVIEGGNRTDSIFKVGLHLGLNCGRLAIGPVSMEITYQLENQTPRMEEPQGSYLDSPSPKKTP